STARLCRLPSCEGEGRGGFTVLVDGPGHFCPVRRGRYTKCAPLSPAGAQYSPWPAACTRAHTGASCVPMRQFLNRNRISFQPPEPALTILTALVLFVAGFL